jgi:hypothetical protein
VIDVALDIVPPEIDGDVAKTTDPDPVEVVDPVPPFPTGRVPETCVVKPIFPHDGAVPTPPEINAFPVATSASLDNALEPEAYKISPIA